ncbi:MAG: hypothetical protein A2902_00375 [Elusimicrobia bacterium RIFCSPLOWO2_01_FULL_64_13]|nr:MAG: hypothetical protein A2902_00375 [Elusimicrobia bacterium RIFCSPLOWO2_01_FULL_64_13]
MGTDALCRSLGLKEKRLARDAARRKGVPPIIPVDPKETDQRAALLKGLEKVLAANDRLEHYKGLRDKVVSDPAWTI